MNERQRTGQCMCGAVQYRVAAPMHIVRQCHCANCRRVSGNFVAAARAEVNSIHIDDAGEYLRWYELDYARYAFCSRCGSTLFYQANDRMAFYSVMVGTLHDADGLALKEIWYADEAQGHTVLSGDVPHLTANG